MSETLIKAPVSEVYNVDCMDYMKGLPDKFFELAIVDPEFGIGIGNSARLVTDKGLEPKSWDNKPIDPAYFVELFRVSVNQIIWGGNYYPLPANKHCIIWDKVQPEALSFGMFDYAWTSFDGSNKIFRQSVQLEKDKIHPTQKPVQLYKWLLINYATPVKCKTCGGSGEIPSLSIDCDVQTCKKCKGNAIVKPKILDTHVGSQSHRIAAYDLGFDFYGCELDPDYFKDGNTRFENHKKQLKLF